MQFVANQPDHAGARRDRSSLRSFFSVSVDRRQANFSEQLAVGRIAVKPDEHLVIAKIQYDLVMRLDADGQVLERFARVAEPPPFAKPFVASSATDDCAASWVSRASFFNSTM